MSITLPSNTTVKNETASDATNTEKNNDDVFCVLGREGIDVLKIVDRIGFRSNNKQL